MIESMRGGLSSLTISQTLPIPSNSPSIFTFSQYPPHINASSSNGIEIRVCTNRTCRRQGSYETLQTLIGISPPEVSVKSCGCLGRCGAGPNLAVLPEGVLVGHCGTATRAVDVMAEICGGELEGWMKSLEALALRKRAEVEFGKGGFAQAEALLSEAIDLKPFGGVHIVYKDRCAARLAMGKNVEALNDAKEASLYAPNYPEAYICQGDVYMALEKLDAAEESYLMALDLDPSFRGSKSFKAQIAKLQDKLALKNLPQVQLSC